MCTDPLLMVVLPHFPVLLHPWQIEATNVNVEGGNAMKKTVGQTLAGGRPIRNKLGTLGGFKTNRTTIEVTTKPSDAMERKIDRLLTIVEELSNKCRAQEDQITDLKKYVSDARDDLITNQEEVYRYNQFRMTATDAAIREIKVLIETTSQTQTKKPTCQTPLTFFLNKLLCWSYDLIFF
jgi:hypothetical protein